MPLTGCGGSGPSSSVAGTVTLDGQPLSEGAITFEAADGSTANAGGSITNGQYSVDLEPGAKKVQITATKVVGTGAPDPASSSPEEIRVSIIPEKYNAKTELTADIKDGENTGVNFEHKSK